MDDSKEESALLIPHHGSKKGPRTSKDSNGEFRRRSSFTLGSRTYGFTAEAKLVENWETDDVCAWLATAEPLEWLRMEPRALTAVLESFREQDITGVALLRLTDDDLRELGVESIGHRKELLGTIQTLRSIGITTVVMETILPSGSIAGATLNLCSAVLGAGALSLPYAFAQAGVLLTMGLLGFAAVATVHTIRLLIFVFEHSRTRTFEDSIEGLAGRQVGTAVEVLSVLFCFGCAVAYIVVLGDCLTALIRWFSLDMDPVALTLAVVFFCLLPPSCFRHIDALRVTSLLGIMAVSVVIWMTVHQALAIPPQRLHSHAAPELVKLNFNTCAAMPIVLFAYSCQVNVWPIYDELKAGEDIRKRKDMMMTASYMSILLSLLAYTLIGYFGYYCFGDRVQGNVVNNFSPEVAPHASICMMISVFAAFPMNFYPMRQAINQLMHKRDSSRLQTKNGRIYPVLKDPTAHFLQTLLLVTAIVVLGLFVPHLNIVFQLIGSLVSSTLCFILPAYLALLVDWQSGRSFQELIVNHLGSVALIIFGVTVAILGTMVTILF